MTMTDRSWYVALSVWIAAAFALGIAGGIAVGEIAGLGSHTASTASSGGGVAPGSPANYANLQIAWNPASGLDEYFPGNLTVPANTVIHVTITNYDNGTNVIPTMFSTVYGTVGGVQTITVGGVTQTVSSLPVTQVAHTFTVMSMSGGMAMGPNGPALNVLVPPAVSVGEPTIVSFDVTLPAGTYTWVCMAPCDPTSMSTSGLMTGSVAAV